MKPTVSVTRCGRPPMCTVRVVGSRVWKGRARAGRARPGRALAAVGPSARSAASSCRRSVARERDRRQRRALTLGAHHRAVPRRAPGAAQRGDAVAARRRSVSIWLSPVPSCRSRRRGARVAPAAHPREVVLRWASSTCSLPSPMVAWAAKISRFTVEWSPRQAQALRSRRLRSGAGQLVVAGGHVGVALLRASWPRPPCPVQGRVRVGLFATLRRLPDHRDADDAQQLPEPRTLLSLASGSAAMQERVGAARALSHSSSLQFGATEANRSTASARRSSGARQRDPKPALALGHRHCPERSPGAVRSARARSRGPSSRSAGTAPPRTSCPSAVDARPAFAARRRRSQRMR